MGLDGEVRTEEEGWGRSVYIHRHAAAAAGVLTSVWLLGQAAGCTPHSQLQWRYQTSDVSKSLWWNPVVQKSTAPCSKNCISANRRGCFSIPCSSAHLINLQQTWISVYPHCDGVTATRLVVQMNLPKTLTNLNLSHVHTSQPSLRSPSPPHPSSSPLRSLLPHISSPSQNHPLLPTSTHLTTQPLPVLHFPRECSSLPTRHSPFGESGSGCEMVSRRWLSRKFDSGAFFLV